MCIRDRPLEAKISDLNSQYANAQKDIADKVKQNEETNKELATAQQEIAGNEKQINHLKAEYANAQMDILNKAKQIDEINKTLSGSQQNANDKQKQITQLQQAIDKGNKDLALLNQQKQQVDVYKRQQYQGRSRKPDSRWKQRSVI